MTDPYTLRTLTGPDEFDGVSRLLSAAFGDDISPEEADRDRWVFEPQRNHVIDDAGDIVANAAAYTRQYSVPGAVVATILQRDFASMAITRTETGGRPAVIAGPPRIVTGRRVLIVDET